MQTAIDIPFELASLARAVNYQRWVADSVRPHLGERIVELGAGIGNMSRWLPLRERLLITEAEPRFIPLLEGAVRATFGADPRVSVQPVDPSGDWTAPWRGMDLDTVVSFNVFEHIEDDVGAMARLVALLRASRAPGPKRIVSFVPAHAFAYGSLDRVFGHHRRYSRSAFRRLALEAAPGAQLDARYFNVFGLPGWLLMGRVLGRTTIGDGAVGAFERMCPWVRGIDDFLHARLGLPLGQSLLAVLTL